MEELDAGWDWLGVGRGAGGGRRGSVQEHFLGEGIQVGPVVGGGGGGRGTGGLGFDGGRGLTLGLRRQRLWMWLGWLLRQGWGFEGHGVLIVCPRTTLEASVSGWATVGVRKVDGVPEELWDVGEGGGEASDLGCDLSVGGSIGKGGFIGAGEQVDGLAGFVAKGGSVLSVETKKGGCKEGGGQDDFGGGHGDGRVG